MCLLCSSSDSSPCVCKKSTHVFPTPYALPPLLLPVHGAGRSQDSGHGLRCGPRIFLPLKSLSVGSPVAPRPRTQLLRPLRQVLCGQELRPARATRPRPRGPMAWRIYLPHSMNGESLRQKTGGPAPLPPNGPPLRGRRAGVHSSPPPPHHPSPTGHRSLPNGAPSLRRVAPRRHPFSPMGHDASGDLLEVGSFPSSASRICSHAAAAVPSTHTRRTQRQARGLHDS